jgi:hypothetical protein
MLLGEVLFIKGPTLLLLSPIGHSEVNFCTQIKIVCGDSNCMSCLTAPFCEEDDRTGQLTSRLLTVNLVSWLLS